MQFDQASNSKPLRFWGAELMYANDVPIPGVLYELPLNFENVQPNMHVLITPSLCFCFALPPFSSVPLQYVCRPRRSADAHGAFWEEWQSCSAGENCTGLLETRDFYVSGREKIA